MRHRPTVRTVAAVLGVALLGAAPALVVDVPAATTAPAHVLHAGGSVEEAWLTGAGPGDSITLVRNGDPPSRRPRRRPTHSGR